MKIKVMQTGEVWLGTDGVCSVIGKTEQDCIDVLEEMERSNEIVEKWKHVLNSTNTNTKAMLIEGQECEFSGDLKRMSIPTVEENGLEPFK